MRDKNPCQRAISGKDGFIPIGHREQGCVTAPSDTDDACRACLTMTAVVQRSAANLVFPECHVKPALRDGRSLRGHLPINSIKVSR